jgi:hypothetical protein
LREFQDEYQQLGQTSMPRILVNFVRGCTKIYS